MVWYMEPDGTVYSMKACVRAVLHSVNFVIILHPPQFMPTWMSKSRSPPLSLRPCLPLMLMRCIATEVKDLKHSLRFVCVCVCVYVCVFKSACKCQCRYILTQTSLVVNFYEYSNVIVAYGSPHTCMLPPSIDKMLTLQLLYIMSLLCRVQSTTPMLQMPLQSQSVLQRTDTSTRTPVR